MVTIKDINIEELEIVSGGWGSAWAAIGSSIGKAVANQAYSSHFLKLHQINRHGLLDTYLESQNDPLL